MVIELKANLPDNPGTLIQFLKPISDNAGNILTVIHSHDEKRADKVPVLVKFDLPPEIMEEKLALIRKALESQSIEILQLNQVVQLEIINIIIMGHVFETDFVDTFKRINDTGAKVVRIESYFTDAKSVSNVKFEIHVSKNNIKYAMEEIRALCQEKNLTLISER